MSSSGLDGLPNDDQHVVARLDELAATAAAGDGGALDELLFEIDARRLAEPAIRRVLISAEDVDDAVQDVLLSVALSIGQFEGRARFTTWLFALARNKAIGVLRRKRGDTDELDDSVIGGGVIGDVPRLSSIVASHETIHSLLAQLPAHYRDAVRLRDLEGLSYVECAEALELNLNTVRSHIARGRALLAEALAS